ncbi:MAG: 4'-phosphopantetheinyl transferase superfamily protein [Chitinophagales bacterium]|nr:4'-phosphopantetheinyl transferase superfamily protein [Chitinophagales bacterium]
MPLHYLKEDENFNLGVWKIEEQESFFLETLQLTEFDKRELDAINAQNKRAQWLASRFLLKKLLGTKEILHLIKDQYGKPHVDGSKYYFSISHCRNYAAVIISKINCGVDIETIETRIERIASKFLYEHEIDPGDENYCTKLTIYWSTKESLYKLYGKKGLTFKTQLLVEPFEPADSDTLHCFIRVNGKTLPFDVSYQKMDDFIISYVTGSFEDHCT